MKKMKKIPENFGFIYSFCLEHLEEIQQLEEKDKNLVLSWINKLSNFQVNYKKK